MIIIAGSLQVAPERRAAYLVAVRHIDALARSAPGCLDFHQSADPLDPGRINVFERWEGDEDLMRFRESDAPTEEDGTPALLSADVRKYRIASVEDP